MYKIPDKTVFMGKKIISLPLCESTNSSLINLAQNDRLEEGVILITENQTKGRGQAGNRWVSEPGANLTFSVLLRPTFVEPTSQFFLNIVVGLGICDAVKEFINQKVQVKWPNDVLTDGKKICGILIENQVQGQQLLQTVVGIGINVNQKNFEWPQASSLSVCAGMDLDRTKVLETILIKIEGRYEQLRSKGYQKLKKDYYSVLYWKDEPHEFSSGEKIFSGTIQGIDEAGRLLVLVSGKTVNFNFKEINFLQG